MTIAANSEQRDRIPTVEDLSLALTYADRAVVNPVTVALRMHRAEALHAGVQEVLDGLWSMVDDAKNRP